MQVPEAGQRLLAYRRECSALPDSSQQVATWV